jgi:hypothetical protein
VRLVGGGGRKGVGEGEGEEQNNVFVVANVYLDGETRQEIILLLIARQNLKGQYNNIFLLHI